MAKRIRKTLPDDYIEIFLDDLDQQAHELKELDELERRRCVQHSCGHRSWRRRPWSEEIRRQLELVECPDCQREWGKHPPAHERSP